MSNTTTEQSHRLAKVTVRIREGDQIEITVRVIGERGNYGRKDYCVVNVDPHSVILARPTWKAAHNVKFMD